MVISIKNSNFDFLRDYQNRFAILLNATSSLQNTASGYESDA